MSDFARDQLDLDDDEDRLPWLEPASDFEDEAGVSPMRLVMVTLAGLGLIAAVTAGISVLRHAGDESDGSEGKLIQAPAGDYKIPAKEADAKKFAGEGDASYAASEGVERDGRIDPSRLPETPVAGVGKAQAPLKGDIAARPEATVTARVATVSGSASGSMNATQAIRLSGTGVVQLGAYGNMALAKDAWAKLSKRFTYLAGMAASVEPVNLGGTTLYRLRTTTGSPGSASALCGKLKVAGESCIVVN